jgi:hypothetical protein
MSLPAALVLKEPIAWVVAFNRALNKELIKEVKTAQQGRDMCIHTYYSRELNKLFILEKEN